MIFKDLKVSFFIQNNIGDIHTLTLTKLNLVYFKMFIKK